MKRKYVDTDANIVEEKHQVYEKRVSVDGKFVFSSPALSFQLQSAK